MLKLLRIILNALVVLGIGLFVIVGGLFVASNTTGQSWLSSEAVLIAAILTLILLVVFLSYASMRPGMLKFLQHKQSNWEVALGWIGLIAMLVFLFIKAKNGFFSAQG